MLPRVSAICARMRIGNRPSQLASRQRVARPQAGGDAVGAYEQGSTARDPERPGGELVDRPDGEGSRCRSRRGHALPPRFGRSGEERQPVAEQIQGRRAPRLARKPQMGHPAAQVGAQLLGYRADRPRLVSGARRVVLRDGAPLGLVRVEQRFVSPAAQDPCELPADIETVANRRVQAGGSARCHAVSRVTDQEDTAVPEALGQVDPERHGRDALDAGLEGMIAGRFADPVDHFGVLEGRNLLTVGIPLRREHPAVRETRRHEHGGLSAAVMK